MIIRGTPKDIENYYLADDEMAFILHQKGFIPKYIDGDATYFKLNNKLIKTLKNLDIEV